MEPIISKLQSQIVTLNKSDVTRETAIKQLADFTSSQEIKQLSETNRVRQELEAALAELRATSDANDASAKDAFGQVSVDLEKLRRDLQAEAVARMALADAAKQARQQIVDDTAAAREQIVSDTAEARQQIAEEAATARQQIVDDMQSQIDNGMAQLSLVAKGVDANAAAIAELSERHDSDMAAVRDELMNHAQVQSGSLMMFYGFGCPSGYLLMNGQQFDVGTYPNLAESIPSGILDDFTGWSVVGRSSSQLPGVNLPFSAIDSHYAAIYSGKTAYSEKRRGVLFCVKN